LLRALLRASLRCIVVAAVYYTSIDMKRKSSSRDPGQGAGAGAYDPALLGYDDDVDYMAMPISDTNSDWCQKPHQNNTASHPPPRKMSKAARAEQRSELMSSARDAALAVPIGTDNKGFHLLSKLGYSAGGGLGKAGQGISQPLAVGSRPVGQAAVGIGVEQVLKEKLCEKERETADIVARREEIAVTFKSSQSQRHEMAKITRELKKNQKLIYNLDESRCIGPHGLWPESDLAAAAAAAADADADADAVPAASTGDDTGEEPPPIAAFEL
jgi:hypothetical protein